MIMGNIKAVLYYVALHYDTSRGIFYLHGIYPNKTLVNKHPPCRRLFWFAFLYTQTIIYINSFDHELP